LPLLSAISSGSRAVAARRSLTLPKMIFTNARVILSDAIRDDIDVVIDEGKIAEFRSRRRSADAVDLRGSYLTSGFIDLHLHGARGRDTMEASVEALGAICDHHVRGGTTSLLLTTVTAPIVEIVSALAAARAARAGLPQIAGVHVEGPFISPEKAGAQNPAFIQEPTPQLTEQLLEYRDVIRRLTIAPEIHGALDCIATFAGAGVRVCGGHSNAWDEEARAGFERGMRGVTHTFNCMSSARRREFSREAGLLEFALGEPTIQCELIADGHHVSATLMRMLYRAKGATGISLVTDATAGAGLADGTSFILGGKKCVVANGAGLLADKSALAGSVSSMIDCIRTMVRDVGVALEEAIAMASRNPAREMGLKNKGEIAVGNDADLVVLSSDLAVEQTFVRGKRIYSAIEESAQ
jgi:N-acetylglucosamine-6-phosphate deacetylase